MAKTNFKITGIVSFAGKSREDEKNVVIIHLTDEQITALTALFEGDYESTPLKVTEDGELVLKTSSKYDVPIYDNGEITEEIGIEEIGKGSAVQLFVGAGEQTYKRKKFLVCYLKSINVLDMVEKTTFNPFTSADVAEY